MRSKAILGTALPVLIALVAIPLLMAPADPAAAAAPDQGTLANKNDEVTWSGGPMYAVNPAQCVGPQDPTCDHFRLYVDNEKKLKRVLVAIAPDEGFEADDYDLFVYDVQGNLLSSSTDPDGYESVVFEPNGSVYYEVRVQPWLTTPGSTYSGVAMPTREQPIDAETEECLEATPATLNIDTSTGVDLNVMVLLDGTDRGWAEEVMARAADAYRPLGIDLNAVKYRRVSLSSVTSGDLITESKGVVGGTRPNGVDLVCTFTDKAMQANNGGATTVVGQADCIGGVRYDNRAFCVVSDIQASEDPQGDSVTGTLNSMGFNPNVDATAEVMAHEIGHLMGGHHHYANCIEGNTSNVGVADLSPCTLMFNAVNFASINFGTLNGTVVRGHAVDYTNNR